ncbi:hypothetical protein CLF_112856, partial [Clonorchis sinensis]
ALKLIENAFRSLVTDLFSGLFHLWSFERRIVLDSCLYKCLICASIATCSTLSVPNCHATRGKHKSWDTATLPKLGQTAAISTNQSEHISVTLIPKILTYDVKVMRCSDMPPFHVLMLKLEQHYSDKLHINDLRHLANCSKNLLCFHFDLFILNQFFRAILNTGSLHKNILAMSSRLLVDRLRSKCQLSEPTNWLPTVSYTVIDVIRDLQDPDPHHLRSVWSVHIIIITISIINLIDSTASMFNTDLAWQLEPMTPLVVHRFCKQHLRLIRHRHSQVAHLSSKMPEVDRSCSDGDIRQAFVCDCGACQQNRRGINRTEHNENNKDNDSNINVLLQHSSAA